MTTVYLPSDPLFPLQWHLLNQGNTPYSVPGYDINVVSVWPDYTGQGVLVGVLDQGMDVTHPDLVQNYRPDLSWDVNLNIPGGALRDPDANHGVAVAGLVAAAADNGVGGVGVAWDAGLVSYRSKQVAFPEEMILSEFTLGAQKMIADHIDVSVNSWGPSLYPFMLHDKQSNYHAVGRELADFGRGSLGVATLFSAGNERQTGLDTNDSPVTTMPWVITVAASDQQGNVTPYSNPGASILVTAPGSWPSSMVTTDRQGTDGYNTEPGTAGDYTDRGFSFFDGTSAAAPVAGGVVALMLEANSGLGYRDIQEILVYSSKRATFLDRDHDFAFNGARDWNGGALLASHDFGFGHIDAHAAVRLAESWTATSTVANLVMEAGQVSQRAVTLEPGQQASLTAYFAPDYRLEQMTVTVNLEGSKLKGATLELISPDGTLSRLINQPPSLLEVIDPDDIEGDDELDEHMVYKLAGYTVNTVLSWGESLAGEWTLRVSNAADGEALHLTDWSILAYTAGEVGPSDSAQIFTDEFARFADLQPERSLIDAANGPVLNAAAVTHDVRFDLSTGISWIGRQELMLDDPAKFQHLVTGDGNDMLIGNAADNILMAGRGNNHVDGGAGLDVMRLIGDASDYTVDLRGDLTVVYSHGLADGGIDVLHNVEVLLFADRVELTREPTDLGPDLFDEAAYLAQYPDIAVGVAAGWLASGYEHYTQWGAAEARNPNALFSEAWYLAANADVALGVREGFLDSGYQHYLNHGWMEGRNPSAWMDASAYLADNPDIAEAQINPFEHYLLHGIHEGRPIVALEADLWI